MADRSGSRAISPARSLALSVIFAVETRGAFADLALAGRLRRANLSAADRRLATQLVYGTVKHKNTLDWALGFYLRQGLSRTPFPAVLILRLAAYQLYYLEKIPAAAACYEAVAMARKYCPGQVGLVNAVLRQIVRDGCRLVFPSREREPVAYLSLKYSHPAWLVQKWLSRLGLEETEKLCAINNEDAPLVLRVNTLKGDREMLVQELAGEGLAAREALYAPDALVVQGQVDLSRAAFFRAGLAVAQDEASILVGHLLAPRPGSLVIDACAGPGTKTTHLAQLMGNTGEIIALDIHPHRLELVAENCRRLGVAGVRTVAMDARELGNSPWAGKASYLLLDAPCSGTGALRRRPDIRWRQSPEKVEENARLQRELLEAAVCALAPGGEMVYSTCSLLEEENEAVIRAVLDRHPEIEVAEAGPWPGPREAVQPDGTITLWPQRYGTDGFFMVRLRRRVRHGCV